MRVLTLAAAALCATAAAARASGPTGTLTLTYDFAPAATLEQPGDVGLYTFNVTAVRDTALFVATEGPSVPVEVSGPGGVVASFTVEATNDGDASGVELRLPLGSYTAQVGPAPGVDPLPLDFRIGWQPDCRGDARTRCTIAPGRRKDAAIAFDADRDAYTVRAKGGRRYAVRAVGPGPAGVGVVDAKGRSVKLAEPTGDGFAARFFLPTRGALPYRVVLAGKGFRSEGGPYALFLDPAR